MMENGRGKGQIERGGRMAEWGEWKEEKARMERR